MYAELRDRLSQHATLLLVFAALGAGPAHADAPPLRFVVTELTVEDTVTKLVWQRVLDPNAFEHAPAVTYCAELELAGKRFRLPTVHELTTLIDHGSSTVGSKTAFPDVPADARFWTSTRIADDGSDLGFWTVDAIGPRKYWQGAVRVRCVAER